LLPSLYCLATDSTTSTVVVATSLATFPTTFLGTNTDAPVVNAPAAPEIKI
jgi:hypothetical protein